MITLKGQRAAIKPAGSTDGIVFDKSVNIEPTKVELVTEVKESAAKKLLGAILLFPKAGEREAKKYWISFDHLLASSPQDLFSKFYDNATATYVGMAKVGVKAGQVFLAQA
jgi:hypothetical protein